MNFGYFSIPRSLSRNPLWLDLPPAYKEVFLVILDHCVWKPTKFDDHGLIIDLLPGQLCISERELLKKCSKYVSLNDVHRGIEKFILYDFVSRKVNRKKSIITITDPDTYALILNASESKSDVNLNQTRIKLESERKKDKKDKKIKTDNIYSPLATSLLTEFFSSLLISVPDFSESKMKHTQKQLAAMERLSLLGEDKVKAIIHYAHTDSFWRSLIHSATKLEKHIETLKIQLQQKGGINGQAFKGPNVNGTQPIDGKPKFRPSRVLSVKGN